MKKSFIFMSGLLFLTAQPKATLLEDLKPQLEDIEKNYTALSLERFSHLGQAVIETKKSLETEDQKLQEEYGTYKEEQKGAIQSAQNTHQKLKEEGFSVLDALIHAVWQAGGLIVDHEKDKKGVRIKQRLHSPLEGRFKAKLQEKKALVAEKKQEKEGLKNTHKNALETLENEVEELGKNHKKDLETLKKEVEKKEISKKEIENEYQEKMGKIAEEITALEKEVAHLEKNRDFWTSYYKRKNGEGKENIHGLSFHETDSWLTTPGLNMFVTGDPFFWMIKPGQVEDVRQAETVPSLFGFEPLLEKEDYAPYFMDENGENLLPALKALRENTHSLFNFVKTMNLASNPVPKEVTEEGFEIVSGPASSSSEEKATLSASMDLTRSVHEDAQTASSQSVDSSKEGSNPLSYAKAANEPRSPAKSVQAKSVVDYARKPTVSLHHSLHTSSEKEPSQNKATNTSQKKKKSRK